MEEESGGHRAGGLGICGRQQERASELGKVYAAGFGRDGQRARLATRPEDESTEFRQAARLRRRRREREEEQVSLPRGLADVFTARRLVPRRISSGRNKHAASN